jgi:polyphosphate kinase
VTELGSEPRQAPGRHEANGDGPDEARDLRDHALYVNRELSWLDFNDRVLELAEDESLPRLGRL